MHLQDFRRVSQRDCWVTVSVSSDPGSVLQKIREAERFPWIAFREGGT